MGGSNSVDDHHDNDVIGGNPNKRKKSPSSKNPLVFLRKVLVGMDLFRRVFLARFAALSKKAKGVFFGTNVDGHVVFWILG